jgi:hypothetical protein
MIVIIKEIKLHSYLFRIQRLIDILLISVLGGVRCWRWMMECMICNQRIKSGESIFIGVSGVYLGPSDDDIQVKSVLDDSYGSMHLRCLQSPTAVARTSNMVVPELVVPNVVEESVVSRSDALGLFD